MNKEEVNERNKEEVVKEIGQVSKEKKVIAEPSTSTMNFRPTNVTDVLLDSIKRITYCNSLAFKAIDDTLPILKMIALACKIDHIDGYLGKLDTLSKFIASNMLTVDKINEETVKERVNKENNEIFNKTIKDCIEHIDSLLPVLNSTILEYKELYKEACKTCNLTEDIEEEIKKTQKEIYDIADNMIVSLVLTSFLIKKWQFLRKRLRNWKKKKQG